MGLKHLGRWSEIDAGHALRTLVLHVGTCIPEVGSWMDMLLQQYDLLPGLIGNGATTMRSTVNPTMPPQENVLGSRPRLPFVW